MISSTMHSFIYLIFFLHFYITESIGSISVVGSPIKLQTSIKNLGIYLDSRLLFNHISTSVPCTTFDLLFTTEAAKTIASALVGSRLDYCNSLLAGTSVSNLARLQLVQNTLARRSPRNRSSIMSHLFSLICTGFSFLIE